MNMEKLTCAIWPWGVETKEQYIEALEDIVPIGYKSFESVKKALYVFPDDPDELWRIADHYGVQPVSFYFHLTDDPKADVDEAKKYFPILARHGVRLITLQAMMVPGGHPTKEQTESTLDVVSQFGVLGKEYGILPCFHPHVNTAVTFEPEIDRLFQNTDPSLIFMAPDTAHLKAAGCDPYTVMKRYGDRIRFTHLKDLQEAEASAAGYKAGVEIYSNFVELGTGDIDFVPISQLLKDVGYDGYYTAELDMTKTTNKESAKVNWDYMKRVFL